jgi:hypothetical protein
VPHFQGDTMFLQVEKKHLQVISRVYYVDTICGCVGYPNGYLRPCTGTLLGKIKITNPAMSGMGRQQGLREVTYTYTWHVPSPLTCPGT